MNKKQIVNFLYNLDRAIASLFGAPPQETISSMVGRYARAHGWDHWDFFAWVLNKIDPGHTDQAIEHADKLNNADDGVTK